MFRIMHCLQAFFVCGRSFVSAFMVEGNTAWILVKIAVFKNKLLCGVKRGNVASSLPCST